jgi:hypothetical protein
MHNNQGAGAVENQATSKSNYPHRRKQRITSARNEKMDHQETNGSH